MADKATSEKALPPHVEHAVRSVADLHIEHHAAATPIERAFEHATGLAGHPVTLSFALAAAVILFAGNMIDPAFGLSLQSPPAWLDLAINLISIFLVLLILATQRRADRLAHRRDQLMLELALVNERKAAKLIEMMEELRRDHPHIADRYDGEAEAMADPADPETVLTEIERHSKSRPKQR